MGLRLDAFEVEISGVVGVCMLFSVNAGSTMSSASLLCLAVEEEVAQDATGAPEETVRPALDAALVLVKDKDRARGDHLAFRIDEPTSNTRDDASAGSFEDQEGIAGSFNPARPGGFCPSVGGSVLRAGSGVGVVGHAAWAC